MKVPVYIVTDPNAKAPPMSCGHYPDCVVCGALLQGSERMNAYADSKARCYETPTGGLAYPWDGPEQTCGTCREQS